MQEVHQDQITKPQQIELQAINQQLRSLSDVLAQLNFEQYKILVEIDQTKHEIETMRVKCAKKRSTIEQETSDKMIIHESLVAANKQVLRLKSQKETKEKMVNKMPRRHTMQEAMTAWLAEGKDEEYTQKRKLSMQNNRVNQIIEHKTSL